MPNYGNAFVDVRTLPQTGVYRVKVDPIAIATGSVQFAAWTVPDDVDAGQYVIGDAPLTIATSSGQNGWVAFQGTAGQRIQMQTSNASYVDGGMAWTWFSPDGAQLTDPCCPYGANQFVDTITLLKTGTYRVKIDPIGKARGSVKFAAWETKDVQMVYNINEPAVTATTAAFQNAWIAFQGTAGQQVQIQSSNATYNGSMGWALFFPDGSRYGGPSAYYTANQGVPAFTLPQTGTYQIKLDPTGGVVGSMDIRVWTP